MKQKLVRKLKMKNDKNKELKSLYIPESKRVTGLHTRCNRCGTEVKDFCGETNQPLNRCPFPEYHRFKAIAHTPDTRNKRRSEILNTRDYGEAVKQTIDFLDEVKNDKTNIPIPVLQGKTAIASPIESKPQNMTSLMARYVGFLKGDSEVVPAFMNKTRSKSHISDVERVFVLFSKSLDYNKIDYKTIDIRTIDTIHVGYFHKLLVEKMKIIRTFNKGLSIFSSFYKYLNEHEKLKISDPFKPVPRIQTTSKVESIKMEDYFKLLEIVQKPELGRAKKGKGVINLYKPWVKDAIELGMATGRRNEEIVELKWNNIHWYNIEKKEGYILTEDIKVNRIMKLEGDNRRFIPIPITADLYNILLRIGLKRYNGQDHYILAPEEETMARVTIKRFMSEAFTHYFRQLKTGTKVTFKSLRKAYISLLSAKIGMENTRLITRHSDTNVMKNHYVDKNIIAMAASAGSILTAKIDLSKS